MLSKSVAVLCVLGIVFSSYLLYLHYTPEELDSSFCNISNFLSCSTVNTSSYATFLGIPVALIGLVIVFSAWAIATLVGNIFNIDILEFNIPAINSAAGGGNNP